MRQRIEGVLNGWESYFEITASTTGLVVSISFMVELVS
jgi:hypothetical protein